VPQAINPVGEMSDLQFFIGKWRGSGRVREDDVTADVTCNAEPDGSIVLVHVTHREGAVDHRERIVVREHRGRTSAFFRSGSGPEQRFQLASAGAAFRFTRADPKLGFLAWEIAPEGADAFTETFALGEGAAAETVVRLRHVRA
jgi:hypothetical protein